MGRVAGVYDAGHDWLKVFRVQAGEDGEAHSSAQQEASKMVWTIQDRNEIPMG